jgi:hypothetical protein
MKRALFLALAVLVAAAPGVMAQTRSGNVYGKINDESGATLPGADVTLSGETGTRTTKSGEQGDFRFLNVDRGRYKLTVGAQGFVTLSREVQVVTGENVELAFTMKVATVEESVTVTAETPVVDTKKRGTAITIGTEELQDVPNARDPWGILRNVPGVLLDRVNVAGNENGQQASVAGKGSSTADKMWNLDGLAITDMSATGASPTYFDFGAFQEVAVTTGGNDLTVQSGGIGINLVTKRGTNRFHGSARYLMAHDDFASSNLPDALQGDSRLGDRDKADHIAQITDYGFDLGGPVIKDTVWFYGTYGKQDIRLVRLTGTPDKTLLPSYNFKLNWQATANTMVSGFYFLGSKQKFGRGVGFGVTETDDFLWNQDNAFNDGGLPGGLWKLEVNHTFSPNFFMTAKGAYYDTGFGLFARGGADKSFTLDYAVGEAIGSYVDYQAIRPQKNVTVDANYFFEGMGGNNELKFGFGYRDVTTTSLSHYNGNQLAGQINAPDDKIAFVYRDADTRYGGKYLHAYVGDVFTKDRLSVNVGARFDRQTAKNLASEVAGNSSFPNVIPGVSFGGSENVIEWNDVSPRVGLSYALDEGRKTVVRASYARYAAQLSFGDVNDENPVRSGFLAYAWVDLNNDRFVQPNEVQLNNFLYASNINPAAPGSVTAVHKVDRNYKAKHDDEFIFGIDRELRANLAVGAAFTWRKATDWPYRPRLGGACAGEPTFDTCRIIRPEEYTRNASETANGFTAFTYSPPAALVTGGAGGRLRTNRPDYFTTFKGLELTLTKRLSNRWMGRVAFSFNDWIENFDGTPTVSGLATTSGNPGGSPGAIETDPLVDGGQVAFLSGGSGKASFYSSVKWQVYANALVQLGWNTDLAAAVFGKQGGPYPVSVRLAGGADGSALPALAVPAVDSNRYDNVWDLDLRLAKTFKLGSDAGFTLSVEAFNVLNSGVVLSRFRFANSAAFTTVSAGAEPGKGRIEEIISPRILRLGARFTF